MSKVIQIACSESMDSMQLFALCEDGSIWQYVPERPERDEHFRQTGKRLPPMWERVIPVPQKEVAPCG